MVAKIESIRPGGTFESTFLNYPLADLLMGILRANLSGRVDVHLHPEARNRMFFKDGVPIGIDLPDTGLALEPVLVRRGLLSSERLLELVRDAESHGKSVLWVIQTRRVLAPSELDAAGHELARAQVVRLFDYAEVGFRFTEGAALDERCMLTILQPLPLVYQGLQQGKERGLPARFVQQHENSTFTLGSTYPAGLDPFEWGAEIERAIQKLDGPLSVSLLVQSGADRNAAGAAIQSLVLSGMAELKEQGAPERARPEPAARRSEDKKPQSKPANELQAPKDPSGGIQILRRPSTSVSSLTPSRGMPAVTVPKEPIVSKESSTTPHEAQLEKVRDRLHPMRAQSYYQLLRVTPGTDGSQLERAYRFLLRRLEDEDEGDGQRVHRELLEEAFNVLCDPDLGPRYARLAEGSEKSSALLKERQAIESEMKVDRALRALGEGHTGEAAHLLSWAERLDPSRNDLALLRRMVEYYRSSTVERSVEVRSLTEDMNKLLGHRPQDKRIKLCCAYLYADSRDSRSALRLYQEVAEPGHPIARRVQELLRST